MSELPSLNFNSRPERSFPTRYSNTITKSGCVFDIGNLDIAQTRMAVPTFSRGILFGSNSLSITSDGDGFFDRAFQSNFLTGER